MKTLKAELVFDAKAELGEGPIWDAELKRLTWVDFLGKKLHAFDPETKKDQVLIPNRPVSACAPLVGGGLVLACEDGLWRSNSDGTGLKRFADPEQGKESVRFNDGKTDPQGRFWVGSLGTGQKKPEGSLYVVDTEGVPQWRLGPVMLSNGLGWSPDGNTFYYIDTPTLEVRAYPFSQASGELGEARVVYQVPQGEGYPDGLAVDAEGKLWVALYLGGCVLRLDPQSGEVLTKVDIPGVSRVTCPGFGGENLETLFVTTAWEHAPSGEREKEPHAGGLFSLKPGVAGLAIPACKLELS